MHGFPSAILQESVASVLWSNQLKVDGLKQQRCFLLSFLYIVFAIYKALPLLKLIILFLWYLTINCEYCRTLLVNLLLKAKLVKLWTLF